MNPVIDFDRLLRDLSAQFLLGPDSLHGPRHWQRVETFGLKLASLNGADVTLVRLFALFHDARRENESWDPQHGVRAAELAGIYRHSHFELDDGRFAILQHACSYHADGLLHDDPTIGACWDADRLDLPRVGVIPDVARLCTAAAKSKEIRHWAASLSFWPRPGAFD